MSYSKAGPPKVTLIDDLLDLDDDSPSSGNNNRMNILPNGQEDKYAKFIRQKHTPKYQEHQNNSYQEFYTNQQGIQHIAFGSIWQFNSTGNGGDIGPIIIEPEDMDFAGGQTQRIYVAGIAGGAIDFSTGVLLNDASDIADDAGTALTTDGVDPRKCFQVGDVIYIHDVDTSIGTVASMTATNITLTANNVGAIADDDEFVGDTPITIKLGFSKS